MKVGMQLGKVKKFAIGWCIPNRMAANNVEGAPLPLHLTGLTEKRKTSLQPKIQQTKIAVMKI